MSAARGSLALAFPLIAPVLVPDEAEACPYPYDCDEVPSWSSLMLRNAAKIPSDGVLVLEGLRRGEGDPLAELTIEVTKDGQPIAGAFETTASRDALVWRPAEPWEPGASYLVEGTVGNSGVTPYCAIEDDIFGGEVFIDSEPAGELGVPEVTVEMTPPQDLISISLDTFACCVGADPPAYHPDYCGGYYLDWDPFTCGPTEATGYFTLILQSSPVADGPVAAEVLYSTVVDGEVALSSFDPTSLELSLNYATEPVCVTIEALDLGTMTKTVSDEQCFGQDFADMLGPKMLVPDLGCPLEQCAVMDGVWDKDQCTPYGPEPEPEPESESDTPTSSDTEAETDDSGGGETEPDQDGDTGCACSSEAGSGPALLLVAPLLLGRRRRVSAPVG
jgi:MYXO-CTERM domain-containing protein